MKKAWVAKQNHEFAKINLFVIGNGPIQAILNENA